MLRSDRLVCAAGADPNAIDVNIVKWMGHWARVAWDSYLEHLEHFGTIRSHLRLLALHRAHAVEDTLFVVVSRWIRRVAGSIGKGAG
jgi:hypothetical protein